MYLCKDSARHQHTHTRAYTRTTQARGATPELIRRVADYTTSHGLSAGRHSAKHTTIGSPSLCGRPKGGGGAHWDGRVCVWRVGGEREMHSLLAVPVPLYSPQASTLAARVKAFSPPQACVTHFVTQGLLLPPPPVAVMLGSASPFSLPVCGFVLYEDL